jgi:hypothetical protein
MRGGIIIDEHQVAVLPADRLYEPVEGHVNVIKVIAAVCDVCGIRLMTEFAAIHCQGLTRDEITLG